MSKAISHRHVPVGRTGNAEPAEVVPAVTFATVALSGADAHGDIRPGAAANNPRPASPHRHTQIALPCAPVTWRSLSVETGRLALVASEIAVLHPLRYVPVYVVQPERVRRERPHRFRESQIPPAPAASAVRTVSADVVPPPIRRRRPRTRHIFPLRFTQPVSCTRCRPIRTFTAQNTGFSGRNRVWLKFTASEDKPHALTAVFRPSFPRKRESISITQVSGFPLSRE